MEEQTGALSDAVDAYLNGEKLPIAQLELIKLYLKQYVERAVLASDANRPRLLDQIAKLRTTREIEDFADHLADFGAEVVLRRPACESSLAALKVVSLKGPP